MSASRIRALDPTLANQIAAGEVVERPASVLKELLENSIDAGAGRIRVDVSRGGLGMVRVSDDGAGIFVDDLALALERHATSKIATLHELEQVRSMGFRGEALPSIASVSRLRIESRVGEEPAAWAVSAEGGPMRSAPEPVAHPPGTTVSVRDLFFNTPVRRRFMRTPRTEFRHLDRVFRRMALAAFPVAMSLSHDGRELLRLAAAADPAARKRRVARILGARFADAAVAVHAEAGGMCLWGWLGAPGLSRDRADIQHLYVNARAVTDTTVRHAVRLGYGQRLADSAQPAWLLYLELDPADVDVNVHPAKQEVRFREARMVHDFVRAAVRSALDQGPDSQPPPGSAHLPGAGEHREAYAAAPPRQAGVQSGTPRLLALLEDGLVVAHLGPRLLLARGSALRRAHVMQSLSAAIQGAGGVSRPLLIPQRLSLAGRSVSPGKAVSDLTVLGFELRPSGPDAALLLAVPDALAQIPADDLVRSLERAAGSCDGARAWAQALADLADETPCTEPDEAQFLLDALHREGRSAPWALLDADAVARLVPAKD